jgi:hypothetical protein
MQAMLVKIAALGSTYQLTPGEIQRRLLLLEQHIAETLVDKT